MDKTTTKANTTIVNTTVAFIKEMAKRKALPKEKTGEVLETARNAIDGAFEMLVAWSDLDGDRTFAVGASETFFVDPIGKRDDSPFANLNFHINLWPFGCESGGKGRMPECKTVSIYFTNRDFDNVESWEAILDDVLATIKGAEELITQANKKED